jgi:hypothetical protein
LVNDGTRLFDASSFVADNYVEFVKGTAGIANGYVMEWSAGASGTTGELRILGTQGVLELGMSAAYGDNKQYRALVTSIPHVGELKYRSGEMLYIQNIKPIDRSQEQKEEIKIVIDF